MTVAKRKRISARRWRGRAQLRRTGQPADADGEAGGGEGEGGQVKGQFWRRLYRARRNGYIWIVFPEGDWGIVKRERKRFKEENAEN